MTQRNRLLKLVSLLFALALVFSGGAKGQVPATKKALLDQVSKNMSTLPAQHQHLLSSGLQRILQLSQNLNNPHSRMAGDGGPITVNPKVGAAAPINAPTPLISTFAPLGTIPGPGLGGTILVSDPRLDFQTSVMTGFTQSETCSAWCSNTVVVGFNDSGAFSRTAGVYAVVAWSFQ